jgi:Helix-turn-helix of DDE superfamily endonuclease
MIYDELKRLRPSEFKRYCGVRREVFLKMVETIRPQLARQGKRGGQSKLCVEDQLLVALEYWREYRTQFHIAKNWGLSEATVCRIVRKVETLLIKSGEFRLPGQKQLYQNASTWQVAIVDVAETPIERPQKNSVDTTVDGMFCGGNFPRKHFPSKSAIPSKPKSQLNSLRD